MIAATRRLLAATLCCAALVASAACSGSSTPSGAEAGDARTTTGAAAHATADLVGPGCSDYAKLVPSGAGSFAGMARDPMATAAGNNPLLTSLVKAVSGHQNRFVNLVDELDRGRLTVFAPVDDAFAKLSPATTKQLSAPSGAGRLRTILTTHVVAGAHTPASIDGTLDTLAGGKITVKGSGDDLTVNGAKVICGGIRTTNATVYLVDSVLDPAGGHF